MTSAAPPGDHASPANSFFAPLDAGEPAPSVAGWVAAPGDERLAHAQTTLGSLRTGQAVDGHSHLIDLGAELDTRLRDWLKAHADQRSDPAAPHFSLLLRDPTRIWASRTLGLLESMAGRARSRVDLLHTDAAGGFVTLSHVRLAREGASISVYASEAREISPRSAEVDAALHGATDFWLYLLGPMSPDSAATLAADVRKHLRHGGSAVKGVLFVVSPTAQHLPQVLQALADEFPGKVLGQQMNLADTAAVWEQALTRLAQFVPAMPAANASPAVAHSRGGASEGARQAPAAMADSPAVPPQWAGLPRHLAQAFDEARLMPGLVWAALMQAGPPQVLLQVAGAQPDNSGPGVASDAQLQASADAMCQLLAVEAAHALVEELSLSHHASSTLALLADPADPPVYVSVCANAQELPQPMARLLLERLAEAVRPVAAAA